MNVALRLLMASGVIGPQSTLSGSYIGGDTSGGSVVGSVVTISGVSIGAAASDREIVVAVTGGAGGSSAPTVTIGGVTAILLAQTSSGTECSLWLARVPTGTTATIVVTYGGAPTQTTCVHVWRITGTIGRYNGGGGSANSTTVSRTVTAYTGGFLLAATNMQTGSVNTTWTNATERYDLSVGILDKSGADAAPSAGSVAVSTGNGVVKTRQMVAGSFGPNTTPPTPVSDDFNRANGAMGNTSVGNKPWSAGGGTGWGISSNKAAWTGTSNGQVVVDTGHSDMYDLQFTATFGAVQYPPIAIVRATTATSYLRIFRDQTANQWNLSDQSNGSLQQFSSATDLVSGDIVRVRVVGDLISLYVNGTLVTRWTSSVSSGGTYQGIGGAASNAVTVDDFSVVKL